MMTTELIISVVCAVFILVVGVVNDHIVAASPSDEE